MTTRAHSLFATDFTATILRKQWILQSTPGQCKHGASGKKVFYPGTSRSVYKLSDLIGGSYPEGGVGPYLQRAPCRPQGAEYHTSCSHRCYSMRCRHGQGDGTSSPDLCSQPRMCPPANLPGQLQCPLPYGLCSDNRYRPGNGYVCSSTLRHASSALHSNVPSS